MGACRRSTISRCHGAPGRALNAALESARLDLERARVATPSPRRRRRGRQRDDPVARERGGGRGGAPVGRIGVPDAQGQGRRGARDRGPRRPGPGDPRRGRAGRSACGSTSTAPGTSRPPIERLEAIARFDIEFVEQPLPPHDVDGLAELRRRVRVPIAADEAAASVRDVRGLLAADAVDALVIKPVRVGGPSAVAAIAELAAERDVAVVISTLFETGIGIAAGVAAAAALPDVASSRWPIPPDHGLATAGLLEHDLLAGSLVIEEGRIRPPWLPGSGGLGIVLDERALERFRVESIGRCG